MITSAIVLALHAPISLLFIYTLGELLPGHGLQTQRFDLGIILLRKGWCLLKRGGKNAHAYLKN